MFIDAPLHYLDRSVVDCMKGWMGSMSESALTAFLWFLISTIISVATGAYIIYAREKAFLCLCVLLAARFGVCLRVCECLCVCPCCECSALLSPFYFSFFTESSRTSEKPSTKGIGLRMLVQILIRYTLALSSRSLSLSVHPCAQQHVNEALF